MPNASSFLPLDPREAFVRGPRATHRRATRTRPHLFGALGLMLALPAAVFALYGAGTLATVLQLPSDFEPLGWSQAAAYNTALARLRLASEIALATALPALVPALLGARARAGKAALALASAAILTSFVAVASTRDRAMVSEVSPDAKVTADPPAR